MENNSITIRADNEGEALRIGAKKLGTDIAGLEIELVDKSTYSVYLKNVPGAVKIEVSKDGMTATLRRIVPPVGAGPPLTRQGVESELLDKGVVFGIDPEAVEKVVQWAQTKEMPPENFVIARGQEPEPGKDGAVEFHFPVALAAGTLNEDTGRIDFKERNALRNIKAGSLVAKITPATSGKDGHHVTGEPVLARAGKEVALVPAGNIRLSEDRLSFYAEIDGTITMVGPNAVAVLKHYVIKGDVDYSTGNLIMDGSLEIRGWIRSGFSVRASGNIDVFEGIEDARVEAGGDLLVKGGIIGGGEHLVRAGRNVKARFLENARLKAGGRIEVKDTISRGSVSARGQVVVQGGKGSILGGTVFSGHGIVANQLGSSSAVKTTVMVGDDPKASNVLSLRKKNMALEKRRSTKERRYLAGSGRPAQQVMPQGMPVERSPMMGKLRRTETLEEMKLEKFKERIAQTNEGDAKILRSIQVKKRAYSGTKIVMGGHYLDLVEDLLKPGTFVLDSQAGEIRLLV
ncbi:MAG: FapA family protein [Planctomycetes bacterium]|nr:FapA family protein [Planctomycetota bacterium]